MTQLFATGRKSLPPHIRQLYPFTSRHLDLGGFRLHYVDQGQGDPVLMVHGNPTWSFFFRSLIQGLSPQFRTIAVDHLGCGLSDTPGETEYGYRLQDRVEDLNTLVTHLDLKRITLVGHDWGGAIGLLAALNHPDRYKRLVIMNTAGFLPPAGKKIPTRLAVIRDIEPLARPAVLKFNLFARGAALMAPARRLSPQVRQGLLFPYDNPQNRLATLKFVQDIPLAPGHPSHDLIQHLDQNLTTFSNRPLLLLWGLKDFVFDRTYFEEWKRRFPRAESKAFPQAGHYLLEDEPEAMLHRILEFLKANPLDDQG